MMRLNSRFEDVIASNVVLDHMNSTSELYKLPVKFRKGLSHNIVMVTEVAV